MTEENIRRAVEEAKRFLAAASNALNSRYDYECNGDRYRGLLRGRASGACRRASMDLTRALSDLRRSGP